MVDHHARPGPLKKGGLHFVQGPKAAVVDAMFEDDRWAFEELFPVYRDLNERDPGNVSGQKREAELHQILTLSPW